MVDKTKESDKKRPAKMKKAGPSDHKLKQIKDRTRRAERRWAEKAKKFRVKA